VSTDGSCLQNGTASAKVGTGMFCTENHLHNKSICLPPTMEQSNQMGEAVATLIVTHVADLTKLLLHITDSKTTLDAVTKCFHKYEIEGFIYQKNSELPKEIVTVALEQKVHTAFQWVKGHNGHPGNKHVDILASCVA
ncbi:ribonuclease H-like domain-containing protein, partial [Lenzites betulinus]